MGVIPQWTVSGTAVHRPDSPGYLYIHLPPNTLLRPTYNFLSMSVPKLTYFPFKGRAELSRLICAAGNLQFVDHRYNDPPVEWATEQANTPFGQVPMLEVNGKKYGVWSIWINKPRRSSY